jgi:hypothetical protein
LVIDDFRLKPSRMMAQNQGGRFGINSTVTPRPAFDFDPRDISYLSSHNNRPAGLTPAMGYNPITNYTTPENSVNMEIASVPARSLVRTHAEVFA